MPASVVKTPHDERLWNRAKDEAGQDSKVKKGSDSYWALVNHIFQNMKKSNAAADTLDEAALLLNRKV